MSRLFEDDIWIIVVRNSIDSPSDCDTVVSHLNLPAHVIGDYKEKYRGKNNFRKYLDKCLVDWKCRVSGNLKDQLYDILKASGCDYIIQKLEDEAKKLIQDDN
ncbi:uncharacterized protein LOC115210911 [Octopus sinensis]|uniref:Uncharacterized protein LOC115210911 n=1 Tax=Octopus sinensis TaxID=2607531 RepID=A0A6P7SC34_9MOLL|nr:uncharacterized protein LOC115210911 [Octopus sinensis]